MEYIGLAVISGIIFALISERKFQTRLEKMEASQEELINLNHRLDLILRPEFGDTEKVNKNLDQMAMQKFVSAAYTSVLSNRYYKSEEKETLGYLCLGLKPTTLNKKKCYPNTLKYA